MRVRVRVTVASSSCRIERWMARGRMAPAGGLSSPLSSPTGSAGSPSSLSLRGVRGWVGCSARARVGGRLRKRVRV